MTADELRALLAERHITRAALAHDLGVTERTVHRWIAGTTPIPRAAAIAIAAVTRKRKPEKAE